jgi:hypothetical protein
MCFTNSHFELPHEVGNKLPTIATVYIKNGLIYFLHFLSRPTDAAHPVTLTPRGGITPHPPAPGGALRPPPRSGRCTLPGRRRLAAPRGRGVGSRRLAHVPWGHAGLVFRGAILMRKFAVQVLERWHHLFGAHYRQLYLVVEYLEETARIQLPGLFATIKARAACGARTQEILTTKAKQLRDSLTFVKAEILSTMDEIICAQYEKFEGYVNDYDVGEEVDAEYQEGVVDGYKVGATDKEKWGYFLCIEGSIQAAYVLCEVQSS